MTAARHKTGRAGSLCGLSAVNMVSGGKIVFSNDVFSTAYRGKLQQWRVTYIDNQRALFEPVATATPPPQKPAPPPPQP